jgi:hypothetical protein
MNGQIRTTDANAVCVALQDLTPATCDYPTTINPNRRWPIDIGAW